LASVAFPDAVQTIGASAFYECGSLALVDLPASTCIDSLAFPTSSLASVVFPDALQTIERDAFSGCSMQ
jgi:hypothetical protein